MKESLEERLKRLEQEQEQQDHDLDDLRDLEEILRLQKRLEEIANEKVEAGTEHTPQVHDEEEVLALESKLDAVEKARFETKHQTYVPDIEVSDEKKAHTQKGYVVCLMFNKKSPSEWSDEGGGGWRERGRGQAYPTILAAEKQLAKLQAQFPDYPLKVFKRA